jgi:L-iditol 2-dehydrogenase
VSASRTMPALVKYETGEGHVEVREVPEPRCGDGQVKVAVSGTGICGTDLHVYHGTFRSHPPVVMGHEFAGTVAEVGAGVVDVQVGERVTVLPASAVTCGRCVHCRSGEFMFCPERRGMGHGVDGAFAPYAVVRPDQLYRVPDHMGLDEAALCEPLAAAVQPVEELSGVRLGDVVLLSGPGPIGLLCLKLLVSDGVRVIVAGTARDAQRREKAREIGAHRVVDVEREDLPAVVRDETGGRGVDLAFECAGVGASARACLDALRPLGTYVQVGIFGRDVEVPLDAAIYKQLVLRGTVGYTAKTWERTMRILEQGRVRLDDLVSHRLPLERWEEAFDLCARGEGIKVLIFPRDPQKG